MASEVEICNMAIAQLGETANISDLNENSAYSDFCKNFYPKARDLLLDEGWSFNTRRAAAARLESGPPSAWLYCYAVPAECSNLISVLPASGDDECMVDYVMEIIEDGSRVLLTNEENAVLRYAVRIIDPTRFSSLFVDTLHWLLVSYLAGPILKGEAGIAAGRAAYSTYQGQLEHALAKDRNQVHQRQEDIPSAIAARYGVTIDKNRVFKRSY